MTPHPRTAEQAPGADCAYDHAPDSLWNFPGDYWSVIEAALVGLPDRDRLRAPALAALDHLKERVTSREARDA